MCNFAKKRKDTLNMKYFTIVFILLVLCGCSNNQAKTDDETATLTTEKTTQQPSNIEVGELTDFKSTFDMSTNPSADNEALKGLKFGISENQYKKTRRNSSQHSKMMRYMVATSEILRFITLHHISIITSYIELI